jgi:thimet oligopeptidase
VSPQKDVRDAGQALAQKVQHANTELNLNQEVYRALKAVDISAADPATRHYMERTLLEYHLAGVDKDAATRAEIKKMQDHITEQALKFGRNIQENPNHITLHDKSELAGLPDDFVAAHAPAANGSITLSTDETDFSPIITYATSDDVRKQMYLAYVTRAYPVNSRDSAGCVEDPVRFGEDDRISNVCRFGHGRPDDRLGREHEVVFERGRRGLASGVATGIRHAARTRAAETS